MASSLFLTFLVAFSCYHGRNAQWEHLRIKFNAWWHMPYSLSEITSNKEDGFNKFVLAAHDSDLNVDLYSYPNDTRVLVMFDTYGNIGGLRYCYVKSDVGKAAAPRNVIFPFDYAKHVGAFYTDQNYWNDPAWCNDILVTSPAKLQQGGREDTNGFPVEELWLRIHGRWVAIPENESEIEALGVGFVKQGCYNGMGYHYFLDMTLDNTCETLVPTTLLFKDGKLIGCNLPSFGVYTSVDRVWFESFTREDIAAMAPNSNACVLDWIFNYGTASCHVSFLEVHRTVVCDEN